jgi:hypothetical protein
MKKCTILLFLSGILAYKSYAQSGSPVTGFGEGIISINQFVFAPGDTVPEMVADTNAGHLFNRYVYYIKNNRILRDDLADHPIYPDAFIADGTKINSLSSLESRLIHPVYLIDWSKKIVYTFSKKKDFVSIDELSAVTAELFYRWPDSGLESVIDSLDDRYPLFIANRECFKGVGTRGKDWFIFYYTKEPLKIRSPLNGLLPPYFPYNVMLVKLSVDWTDKEGRKAVGTTLFQISGIKENKPDDSLFTLPPGIHIRKSVPLQELYSDPPIIH